MKLKEIAGLLGAELVPGEGQQTVPDTDITSVAGIESAGQTDLTFVANAKYALLAKKTGAGAILVEPGFASVSIPTLRVANPYLAFARAIELFHKPPVYAPEIHPTAAINPSARIGQRAHIGAYVVIGENCVVGDDAVLLPHAVLYPNVSVGHRFLAHAHSVVRENCTIGDDVVLQNGVIVGGDGFGFAKDGNGRWVKIHQSGPTVIEDKVEIQANSTVDRASIGETRIRSGAKIDNLVQVGHGSVVGEDTLLCAQVGLAGSSIIGSKVILAGQVGVAGHLTVNDGAVVTAQSGLHNDVPAGAVVSGSPAMDNRSWLRSTAAFHRLPELMKKLRDK